METDDSVSSVSLGVSDAGGGITLESGVTGKEIS